MMFSDNEKLTGGIMKINCWEFKKCGREPGGAKVNELGVCPSATNDPSEGINKGKKGGRYCWKLAGTFCGGKVEGTWAAKLLTCVTCDFFKRVKEEEGDDFKY